MHLLQSKAAEPPTGCQCDRGGQRWSCRGYGDPSSLLALLRDHHCLNRPERLLTHSLSKPGAGHQQHKAENVEEGAKGHLPWLSRPGRCPGPACKGRGMQRCPHRSPLLGGSRSVSRQLGDRVIGVPTRASILSQPRPFMEPQHQKPLPL